MPSQSPPCQFHPIGIGSVLLGRASLVECFWVPSFTTCVAMRCITSFTTTTRGELKFQSHHGAATSGSTWQRTQRFGFCKAASDLSDTQRVRQIRVPLAKTN